MNNAAPHTTFVMVPAETLDALMQRLERIESLLVGQQAPAAGHELETFGIDPSRVYTVKETAELIRMSENAVYELSPELLPRTKRAGRRVGFLGLNIIRYRHELPPIDVGAATERLREKLMQERPNVQPLRMVETGKTRVL